MAEVSNNLDRIKTSPKTGEEPFRANGADMDFKLIDFWKWSVSDIVSNATRGRLAEFIVAKALGIETNVARDEWESFDLKTKAGKKIQVKSAAYIQGWKQKKLSNITFSIKAKRSWDADMGMQAATPSHQSDVYVFALLTPHEEPPIDPLNINQWQFYVWSTSKLSAYPRSKHSITLKSRFLDVFGGWIGWNWSALGDDTRRNVSSIVGFGPELESDPNGV